MSLNASESGSSWPARKCQGEGWGVIREMDLMGNLKAKEGKGWLRTYKTLDDYRNRGGIG